MDHRTEIRVFGSYSVGVRAHAFGRTDCCCVQTGFRTALEEEADGVLADLLTFTRVMGHVEARRISLSPPGSGRMTRDEVSVACGFVAAQAWDAAALDAHLSWLLAGPVPRRLTDLVIRIADSFAGHGLAFEAPHEARAVEDGVTLAFR